MPTHWSDTDHDLMDTFLGRTYDDVTSGLLDKTQFIDRLADIMTALQMGEHFQALDVFRKTIESRLRLVVR